MSGDDLTATRGFCLYAAVGASWAVAESGGLVTLAARFPDGLTGCVHVRVDDPDRCWPLDVLAAAENLRNAWVDGVLR